MISAEITLREATSWNALRKGLAVARLRPNDIVLAADTLVALDGHVLGKPANRADAARILRLLSGRTHEVTTGVFVAHLRAGQSETFCVTSQVAFKKLSDRMIQDYLARIDPLDKAGGYAAQGKGRMIISQISGSRSNVIGLPTGKNARRPEAFRPAPATPKIRLTNFEDFVFLRRQAPLLFPPLPLEHPVKEPDDEAIERPRS